jgi:glycerophosphoryl diester phosphodiesterase
MVAMLGTGVDGLITDDPALARAVLAERAEASLAEKVLLDLASFLGRKPPVASQ